MVCFNNKGRSMHPGRSTKLKRQVAQALRQLAPLMPLADFLAVEAVAAAGHLRHLPPTIIAWQALTTHVRHEWTDYDALIAEGYDRDAARHFVADAMNETLSRWGCSRRIEEG